jgi:hypothetical protein
VRLRCGITVLDEYTAIVGWRTEVRRYKSKVKDARLKSKSRRPLQIQKQNKRRTAETFAVVSLVSLAFLQE